MDPWLKTVCFVTKLVGPKIYRDLLVVKNLFDSWIIYVSI